MKKGSASAWFVAILLVGLAVFLLTYEAPAKTRYIGDCGSLENATFNTRCDGDALVFETCFNGTITEERTDCKALNQSCLTETGGNETVSRCGEKSSASPNVAASAGPYVPPEYRGLEGIMVETAGGLVRAIDLPDFVPNSCGDGKCSVSETCLSCAKDCGCKAGEKCRQNGLCSALFAGTGCANRASSARAAPTAGAPRAYATTRRAGARFRLECKTRRLPLTL